MAKSLGQICKEQTQAIINKPFRANTSKEPKTMNIITKIKFEEKVIRWRQGLEHKQYALTR